MKRCSECGYRVKADLKKCPLCDGRMIEDRVMTNESLHTQSHKAEGGNCLLEEKPVKPQSGDSSREGVSKGRWANNTFSPMRFLPIVIVVLFALLRSCSF